jgi:hypothetical protein
MHLVGTSHSHQIHLSEGVKTDLINYRCNISYLEAIKSALPSHKMCTIQCNQDCFNWQEQLELFE